MRVFKGNIITCDEKNTVAKYLVVKNGRIAWTGQTLPDVFKDVKTIDLGKRALIPSFADSHIHFASFATFHAGLNVMNARSNAEILEMLENYVKDCDEKLIMGFGASPYSVLEGKLISRQELDSVCPDKPVFIGKYDGHACVINTPLLEKLRKKIEHLRGFHEYTGEMNQEAFFAVSDAVTGSISLPKLVRNMENAANYMASKGIGMIHTVSGVGFPADMDVDLERWFAKGLDNGLQMRVFFQTMNVDKVRRRKLPRIGGCFETALDGCFGSADAALKAPYELSDDKGVLYYSDEKVTDFCKKANRAGLQIEMHAIGDAAFDQATRALKEALDDFPRRDHRHTIIHCCLPTPEGIQICKEYKILMAVQSAFIGWDQEPDSYLETLLGKERANDLNPLRTFADAGIIMSAGSDAPCTDPDPIMWIHKACNHSNPAQRLTVMEALKMCTYNGYYTTFDEKERGSLERGKIADMVVLSENPLEVPVSHLKDIKVQKLLLGGRVYWPVHTPAAGLILRGLITK